MRTLTPVSVTAALFLSRLFSYTHRDLTLKQNCVTLKQDQPASIHQHTNTLWTWYITVVMNYTSEYSLCTSTLDRVENLVCLFCMTYHLLIMPHCKREKGKGVLLRDTCSLWAASLLSCHLVFCEMGIPEAAGVNQTSGDLEITQLLRYLIPAPCSL